MLFLDKVDSLIFDRGTALRSWEVTQVNELLSRMEEYRGSLLTATNRLDALDVEVRRRFDFEIEFRYLTPEQRWSMFAGLLQGLGVVVSELEVSKLREHLDHLDNLAPGDLAAVARHATFIGSVSDGS